MEDQPTADDCGEDSNTRILGERGFPREIREAEILRPREKKSGERREKRKNKRERKNRKIEKEKK
jgi:hypothetical protein